MARSTSAPPPSAIHPIDVLRQHVTALEAAITVTLASPKKDAVHRVRTSTRRIEAQLALLALLPELPEHAKQADKVLHALGKLRREAGKVRDLDVQRKLLDEAPAHQHAATEQTGSKAVERQAKSLRRTLKHRREELAEELQHSLKRKSRSISRKLEKLMSALEDAEQIEITAAQLSELTRTWFRTNMPGGDAGSSPDGLHSIRKAAKLARYIAESAVNDAGRKSTERSAGDLAKEFETLQQSGGDWHDLLTLAAIARHELGKRDPLTRELDRRCEAALRSYQEQLRHVPA